MTMLELSGVSVAYGQHVALRDISLTVDNGEVAVMLGANGAGKSTLLKAIAGLVAPLPGARILLDGEDLTALPAHRIVEAGIALVPEGRGIFGAMTVRENLRLGAYAQRARRGEKQRLDQVLQLFPKLVERADQIVQTMSGGEQQMVAIGRALMSAPRFLLLDEPSLGLSPIMTSELFKALTRIREIDVSVLLVEQNARASLDIADRVYLIEQGRNAGSGPSADMKNNADVQRAYLGKTRASASPQSSQ
jgi:branched-chain amino acid transport system ATP-binding protein